MSPFAAPQVQAQTSWATRFSAPLVLAVLLASLAVGSTTVIWRVKARLDNARARAQAEAAAAAVAMESACQEALAPAEFLAAAIRHSSGSPPDFQKLGSELVASRPTVAWLELQPGGITSDVVPQAGNERLIGLNVWKDPVQRAGANLSMQRRLTTVTGPVRLPRGDPGMIARVPVIQRGRDGRESFWGFISVSVRLADLWKRGRLDEIASKGYDYAVQGTAVGTDAPITLTSSGNWPMQLAVLQPVRVHNLEFRLALQPKAGWFSKAKVTIEALAVLVGSCLLALLAVMLASHPGIEKALAEAQRQLVRETTERKQVLENLHGAQERLTASNAELKQAQTSLAQAEHKLVDAVRAHKATIASAQTRADQDTATIEDLKGRLEQAAVSIRQATETGAAGLKQLDETNRKLKSRLTVAEQAENRVAELKARLEQSAAEAAGLRSRLEQSEARFPALAAQLAESQTRIAELTARTAEGEATRPQLEVPQRPGDLNPTAATPEPIVESVTESAGPAIAPSESDADPATKHTPPKTVEAEPPFTSEQESVSASPEEPWPAAESDLDPDASPPVSALPLTPDSPAEPHAEVKTPKPHRRKKGQDQMDLFGAPAPEEISPAEPAADTPPQAPEETLSASDEEAEPSAEADDQDRPVVEAAHIEALSAGAEPVPSEKQTVEDAASRKEHKRVATRSLPPAQLAEFRTVLHQIVPLISDQDPGAKDCFKDNRTLFRSAFAPETYAEFEQSIKGGRYSEALECLRKAARKFGISV
jgi:sensor domain CHASE-containing protein